MLEENGTNALEAASMRVAQQMSGRELGSKEKMGALRQ